MYQSGGKSLAFKERTLGLFSLLQRA